MPIVISLLQMNVCYGSLLIMNKEGIFRQCNNTAREEESAVGRPKPSFAMSCTH